MVLHPVFECETQKTSLQENLSRLQKFVDIRTQFLDPLLKTRLTSNVERAHDAFPPKMG
jgi:hypothetical protein